MQNHSSRYLVKREEMRSIPTPTVLVTSFNSPSPRYAGLVGSSLCKTGFIYTRSILTSLRSCTSLRTMRFASLGVSPALKRVPV